MNIKSPEHRFGLFYPSAVDQLDILSRRRPTSRAGEAINAADPGYTKTDFNGHTGYRTVEQTAEAPVRLAMLGPDGPTAGYFFDDQTLSW